MSPSQGRLLDLLVVGSGPTGISIAAEARANDLDVAVVDQGPLLANLLDFPRDMVFFTTRERLEIAGVPFAIPDPKPTRRQAIAYYQSVVSAFDLDLRLHQKVVGIEGGTGRFEIVCEGRAGQVRHRARAVALATGYFDRPRHLGVPGESLPWIHHRYDEPYRHFGEQVVVVGGGNSAAEAAIELWRGGARVTLVHRRRELKPSVKYWLKPDFENRVAEGSLEAHYESRVVRFADNRVSLRRREESFEIAADAVYVLIGYEPNATLLKRGGIEVDAETLVPVFDPETCETNVPGLYVAGTLQAGRDTNRIFIENSRDHSPRIVAHLKSRLGS
jgi:thioredoxin reductase (NADPH)